MNLTLPLNSHTDRFICKENASVLFIQWKERLQREVRSVYFFISWFCRTRACLRGEASLSAALSEGAGGRTPAKAYKAAVIISILFTPLVDAVQPANERGPTGPRHFVGRRLLRENRGTERKKKKVAPEAAVRNYVSVLWAKQASAHSLKGPPLDPRFVLTSCGQIGGRPPPHTACMNQSRLLWFRIDSLSWQPPAYGHAVRNCFIWTEID